MKTRIIEILVVIMAVITFIFLQKINVALGFNITSNPWYILFILVVLQIALRHILLRIKRRTRYNSAQHIYKEIAGVSQHHSTHRMAFSWRWGLLIRSILLWVMTIPIIIIAIVFSLAGVFDAPRIAYDAFGIWFGILLIWTITLWLLFVWLRTAALLFFQVYSSRKKGAFLRADQQALEYCLFPAVAWQYVQSISLEVKETSVDDSRRAGFSQYGICLTLDAAWHHQRAIPRWYALLFRVTKNMRQLKEHNILYLPCNILGRDVLLASTKLIMLRLQYAQRTGAWSPELLEKLAQANIQPEEWLTEKITAVQIKLAAMIQFKRITDVEQNTIHSLLQQFNDFFTRNGGSWSDELDKCAEKARKKEQNLHQELHVIEQVLAEIHACTNPSPAQAARKKILSKRAAQLEHRIAALSTASP